MLQFIEDNYEVSELEYTIEANQHQYERYEAWRQSKVRKRSIKTRY